MEYGWRVEVQKVLKVEEPTTLPPPYLYVTHPTVNPPPIPLPFPLSFPPSVPLQPPASFTFLCSMIPSWHYAYLLVCLPSLYQKDPGPERAGGSIVAQVCFTSAETDQAWPRAARALWLKACVAGAMACVPETAHGPHSPPSFAPTQAALVLGVPEPLRVAGPCQVTSLPERWRVCHSVRSQPIPHFTRGGVSSTQGLHLASVSSIPGRGGRHMP